ncbi:MAG: Anthranilate 1,2-dioxygenase large subunit [candidate division BRC1 bacterium ADurb.BinA292]|nr:MAG: Anthranilate 1,2-dioxygenase large subunit [candidate division BRC1 bacterium ADurb.BinA292]
MATAETLIQPSFVELLRQQREGYTLDQCFYSSEAIFERDMENIYRANWIYAGHVSEIPKPGDYFIYKLSNSAVIIIRDAGDQIHALANSCRHRGSIICKEASGHAKKLVCPYHAWVYEPDGTLTSARMMPEEFDKSSHGLHRYHCRVVEGLIHICLAEKAPDFEPIARDIERFLKPHGLTRIAICHRKAWICEANWKLVMENFQECYHCGPTHPEYCSVMPYYSAELTRKPDEVSQRYREFVKSWHAQPGRHDPEPVEPSVDRTHDCSRTLIGPGHLTQSKDGQPIAKLLGDYTEYDGAVTTVRIVTSYYNMANDWGVLLRITPLGPQATEVRADWFVHEDAEPGKDFDVEELTWLWRVTYGQDIEITQNNQYGVNDASYRPAPYAPIESGSAIFTAWYLKSSLDRELEASYAR